MRLILISIISLTTFSTAAQQDMKLWYDKPAANWNEALPVGNGKLAAMIFGNPQQEVLQLNEETIWTGAPYNNITDSMGIIIPQLRKLLYEKKYVEAQKLSLATMRAKQNGMSYQPAGDFVIDINGHEYATEYHRELDISKAVSNISYKVAGVKFYREIFTSLTENAIMWDPLESTCRHASLSIL